MANVVRPIPEKDFRYAIRRSPTEKIQYNPMNIQREIVKPYIIADPEDNPFVKALGSPVLDDNAFVNKHKSVTVSFVTPVENEMGIMTDTFTSYNTYTIRAFEVNRIPDVIDLGRGVSVGKHNISSVEFDRKE